MSKFKFLDKAYIAGKWVDFQDANVSIATNALHFGTAAWGGMRVKVNIKNDSSKEFVIFRIDEHVKRLFDGSKMLYLLDQHFSEEFLKEKILEFIEQNKNVEKDFYIRPIIYASGLGPMPTFSVEKDLAIYGTLLGDYLEPRGISVCVSSLRRQEDIMIPTRGKIAGAYYISCAAKTEANLKGYDDAIMLNMNGKVSEGSAMNIFMVRDNELVTIPGTENILEGITRKSVIEIAKYLGITVSERQIDLSELEFKADEVFFTGTAARITPCRKIENFTLKNEMPICKKIQAEFEKIYTQEEHKFSSWLTKVNF